MSGAKPSLSVRLDIRESASDIRCSPDVITVPDTTWAGKTFAHDGKIDGTDATWRWALRCGRHVEPPGKSVPDAVFATFPANRTADAHALHLYAKRYLNFAEYVRTVTVARLRSPHLALPPPDQLRDMCAKANAQNRVLYDMDDLTDMRPGIVSAHLQHKYEFIATTRIYGPDRLDGSCVAFFVEKSTGNTLMMVYGCAKHGVPLDLVCADPVLTNIVNNRFALSRRLHTGIVPRLIAVGMTLRLMKLSAKDAWALPGHVIETLDGGSHLLFAVSRTAHSYEISLAGANWADGFDVRYQLAPVLMVMGADQT